MNKKITTIDLFAGCGGLGDGFEQSGFYETLAVVEWEEAPLSSYENRLRNKWGYKNAHEMSLLFDIQRTDELLNGWNDEKYGQSKGLKYLTNKKGVDLVVGGPPCQAYSVAGRVRDANGMRDDYRNYLFESYVKIVGELKPKAFVFENVPGILSAKPDGTPIIDRIKKAFDDIGYAIIGDLRKAVIHMEEYGVPQKRDRVIILGLNKAVFGDDANELVKKFYSCILPKYKTIKPLTVRDAIGDLPPLYPIDNGGKQSHSFSNPPVPNHEPRYHSKRDVEIFGLLANDIESGKRRYTSTASLKELYFEKTGKQSEFHKYHVLEWNSPSTLIPAHLWKDGLRHIHPDPKQARTITVREAARLQGFPDDFVFTGSRSDNYKMIGNAVPPLFSKVLALALKEMIFNVVL